MRETWPLDKLRNWDKNPRAIDKKDYERLKKQIQELGQYKPLLVTKDGEVLGGNMRLRAYQDLNINDIWVSIVDPKTEAQKVAYALSDNDRAGYYVDQELAELIVSVPELNLNDYRVDLGKPTNLQDLLDKFGPEVEEDEAPDVPEEAISKLGEVYQLGRHRLMCGDATKIEDVEKLMDGKKADMVFTDPPYGIDIVDKKGNIGGGSIAGVNTYSKIIGDDKLIDIRFLLNLSDKVAICGGNYFTQLLPPTPCWIIWDKREDTTPDNHADCEIVWTNFNRPSRIYHQLWRGMIRKGENGKKQHPTQKPMGLTKFVCNYGDSKQDNIILDLFGGSGSTLIACEQTNRICYMMELDPKYCDVIRTRYDNYIQNKGKQ